MKDELYCIISMIMMPCARKVQNRPQQPVTIFPNPQINQEYIKAALTNQQTNKLHKTKSF